MPGLSIESILAGISDPEKTQYAVLAQLQEARAAFSRNAIYPYLSQLVDSYNTLDRILSHFSGLRDSFPAKLKCIDPESGAFVYDYSELSSVQIDTVAEIISWALPLLLEAIEEGKTIFEFVDGHLMLEEVGILPTYVEEGYLLLPDSGQGTLEILQYELSIYSSAQERYRTLKTRHIRTIHAGSIIPSPSSIKLELMNENRSLPNPATYCLRSDIDFPFESTILPVAKRKLMHRLYGKTGIA